MSNLSCLSRKKCNGILFPKNFWPTVRKNCYNDPEKLLKLEAEGQEFAKVLRSLKQFIRIVKGLNNFCKHYFIFFWSWRFFNSNTLEQFKCEKIIGIQKPTGKNSKLLCWKLMRNGDLCFHLSIAKTALFSRSARFTSMKFRLTLCKDLLGYGRNTLPNLI